MLEDVRRAVVEYDITFDSVLRHAPQGPKPERLRLFPDPAMWPRMVTLGVPLLDNIQTMHADGSDYQPQAAATVYFPDRCTLKLKPQNYQTLLLKSGLDKSGNIANGTYVTVCSKGSVDGNVTFTSYGNLFVWGDLGGNVYSNSYFGGYVSGDVRGILNLDSASTVYVLGKVTGTVVLGSGSSKVWVGGRTTAEEMGHFEGRGHLFLADSDMTAGEHTFGDLHVTVLPDGVKEP